VGRGRGEEWGGGKSGRRGGVWIRERREGGVEEGEGGGGVESRVKGMEGTYIRGM